MIAIIDYGLGNLGSIQNMLKRIGVEAIITEDGSILEKADKLILPGVGAFDNGVKNIDEKGLRPVLNKCVLEQKKPILGICLGMQLLTRSSDEGKLKGLSWISADTKKFDFTTKEDKLRIPHMGWNEVKPSKEHFLTKNLDEETRFYFVHSYFVQCDNDEDILMTCDYGGDFTCAVQKDNIIGVQFHPEKSHKFGMTMLKSFAEMN